MLTVGIPTIRPLNLRLTLPQLTLMDGKEDIDEVIVVAPKECFRVNQIKLLISVLKESIKNLEVTLLRNERGLGRARADILQNAKTDYLLFLDDDVLLSKNTIYELLRVLHVYGNYDFALPILLNPPNKALEDWFGDRFIPSFPSDKQMERVQKIAERDNYYLSMFYKEEPKFEETNLGNGACLMLRTKRITNEILTELAKKDWGEDRFLTLELGKGIINRRTCAWHLLDVNQRRRWDSSEVEVFDRY